MKKCAKKIKFDGKDYPDLDPNVGSKALHIRAAA